MVFTTSHTERLTAFERYRFSLYDSMLIAAALIAGAKGIYSEDLQHGQARSWRLDPKHSSMTGGLVVVNSV